MRVLIQRVTEASVTVEGDVVGAIGGGLLCLVAMQKGDDEANVKKSIERVLKYRVFSDDQGRMNQSALDTAAGILWVSQFTLAADTRKGLRPGFSDAAAPDTARALYDFSCEQLRDKGLDVAFGQFGADMKVALVNDGPVTFMLDFPPLESQS